MTRNSVSVVGKGRRRRNTLTQESAPIINIQSNDNKKELTNSANIKKTRSDNV